MSKLHITEYDEVAQQIDEVKEYSNFIPDVTTKEGYEKSKRVSLDIGKLLTALEKKRKSKKEYFINGGKEVDAQAKAIKDQLVKFQEPHKLAYKQLDEEKKAREAQRKQGLEDRIAFMRNLPEMMADSSSDEIKQALNDLAQESCEDFYEYTVNALKARNESIEKLNVLLAKTVQYEKDQAELEELRKLKELKEAKENEERIAQQAKSDAQAEIERAQAEAEEARLRAEEAERKAKEEADLAIAQAEAQRKAEAQRLEDEAKARQANTEHRAKINNGILSALVENGFSEEDGKKIITLAVKGKLPNLTINY